MALANRIGVWKAKTEGATHLAVIFHNTVDFATDILTRSLHLMEQTTNRFLQVFARHGLTSVANGLQGAPLIC